MNVSLDLFHEIVTTLQPQGGALTGENRREPRVRLGGAIKLIPAPDALTEPVEVQLRDLSASGIGFLYPEKMQLDGQVVALLPTRSGVPVAILCTIAYYEPLGENLFGIGAKFTAIVDLPETARRLAS